MTKFTPKRNEVLLIEESHLSLFRLMEQISYCVEYALPENFKILVLDMEQVFKNEQRLMEKSHFPAMKCHLEQHARVLAALHHVHRSVMQGDNALARRVGCQLLSDWFKVHTTTLDQALFVWVASRKNLVLRQLCSYQIKKKQNFLRASHSPASKPELAKTDYRTHC